MKISQGLYLYARSLLADKPLRYGLRRKCLK
nr:MAG TPA: hypothetical protein [Bacteriophage sp.]